MSEHLKFEVDQGIATITLDRPEKMNAFTDDMLEKWLAALEECRTNPEVRVIVITGTGRAFTTGGDIGSFSDKASQTAASVTSGLMQGASDCRASSRRSTNRSSPPSTGSRREAASTSRSHAISASPRRAPALPRPTLEWD